MPRLKAGEERPAPKTFRHPNNIYMVAVYYRGVNMVRLRLFCLFQFFFSSFFQLFLVRYFGVG